MDFRPTDCLLFLRLAISPDSTQDEAVLGSVVGGSVCFRIAILGCWASGPLNVTKRAGRTTRTMVLSETRPQAAGLTLLPVLRGGLGLCSCLGVTMAGRTKQLRLPLVPSFGNLKPRREVRDPHRCLEVPRYVDCLLSNAGS